MKRVFALTLVLMVISTGALSETYDGEILFRGIHWLTSIDTFTNALDAEIYGEGYEPSLFSILIFEDAVSFYDITNDYYSNYEFGVGFSYLYSASDAEFYVAGYLVSFVSGNALYGFSENGFVNREKTSSRVINAKYALDDDAIKDADSVYYDLREKLTTLYGDPAIVSKSTMSTVSIWFGSNDTYVILRGKIKKGEMSEIYIEYGLTNVAELIQEVKDAGSPENPENNTDGL